MFLPRFDAFFYRNLHCAASSCANYQHNHAERPVVPLRVWDGIPALHSFAKSQSTGKILHNGLKCGRAAALCKKFCCVRTLFLSFLVAKQLLVRYFSVSFISFLSN